MFNVYNYGLDYIYWLFLCCYGGNIKMQKDYVIAISFVNYLNDKTGVAKVLLAHQLMYNAKGISYVDLYSVKKNILNDRIMLFCKFGLIIDGEFKGIYQMSQIIHMLYKWQNDGKELLDIHVHHFLYTRTGLVDDLLKACSGTPIKVYLHDYYNVCSCYTLLKNGKQYCGGNGFSDSTCAGCKSTKINKRIQPRLHHIFRDKLDRIMFISPSETTKIIFTNFYPEYKDKVIVIPHQKYNERYKGNLEILVANEKIKIAFLGMPRIHKGWGVWSNLIEKFSNKNYEFIVFNSSDDNYNGMKKVKIGFSKNNLNAMADALRQYKVHIVLLWALWPETYSYTCFEAFSSNAFIITNKISGNITDVVQLNRNGLVLNSEEELMELLGNENKLRRLINTFRYETTGGPADLHENNEIVELSLAGLCKKTEKEGITDCHKPVNYPLLWVLNRFFRNSN